jgi:hypothetical protein
MTSYLPITPVPPPDGPPPWVVALAWAAALATLLAAAAAAWPGCTIRGGACGSDDSCTPGERCVSGRCLPIMAPPRPRPVPSPGGPL